LAGIPQRLLVVGDLVYVAAKKAGVRVLDVSDPTRPREVGFYETPLPAWDLAAAGGLLLIAAGDLHILDIHDPVHPSRVGFFEDTPYHPDAAPGSYGSHEMTGVAVQGDVAYTVGRAIMRTIDLRQPNDPVLLGTEEVLGQPTVMSPSVIQVDGDYAFYVNQAGRGSGLHIIDVANPLAPMRVAFIGATGSATGAIGLGNGVGYLATSGGVSTFDLAIPGQPQTIVAAPSCIRSYSLPPYSWDGDLVIQHPYAYFVEPTGLHIVDVSDPLEPTEVSCFGAPVCIPLGVDPPEN
jgi:hypothetical protein